MHLRCTSHQLQILLPGIGSLCSRICLPECLILRKSPSSECRGTIHLSAAQKSDGSCLPLCTWSLHKATASARLEKYPLPTPAFYTSLLLNAALNEIPCISFTAFLHFMPGNKPDHMVVNDTLLLLASIHQAFFTYAVDMPWNAGGNPKNLIDCFIAENIAAASRILQMGLDILCSFGPVQMQEHAPDVDPLTHGSIRLA